jgi:hypothetical protein
MRRMIGLFLWLIAGVGIANCGSAMAQSSDAGAKFYRLDFVVKELDQGKVVNSRSYSTLVSTEAGHGRDGGSIRAGTRIPININSPDSKEPNIQYMDLGVNIDCNGVRLVNGQLVLGVMAEITTLAMDPMREGPGMMAGNQPMTAPMPSKERGGSTQKEGPDGAMPPLPPPPAGMGEQPMPTPPQPGKGEPQLRTPPPGARTNMMMASMRSPVIRQNRWSAVATVPTGKAITLFASDDIASKKRMEVELTATEVR